MRVGRAVAASAGLIAVAAIAWAQLHRKAPVTATMARERARHPPERFVVAVTDSAGGWAGVLANDGEHAGPRSAFRAAGLDVDVRLLRGTRERLAAFEGGQVDVLAMPLPTLAQLLPSYRGQGVAIAAFWLGAYDRGGVGVAVAPRVRSLDALDGALVATVERSAAHFVYRWLERAQGRGRAQLKLVQRPAAAVELFRRGEVDAVALPRPWLDQAIEGDKGRVLVSTRSAARLLPEVLVAHVALLAEREAQLRSFVRAWDAGARALVEDGPRAGRELARAFGLSEVEVGAALAHIEPAGAAESRRFFEGAPSRYQRLFADAAEVWRTEGLTVEVAAAAPAPPVLVGERASDATPAFRGGKGPRGTPLFTRVLAALAAEPGGAVDAGATPPLDELGATLDALANTWVRVEVTADARNPASYLAAKRRAAAIVDALVDGQGLERPRFSVSARLPEELVAGARRDAGRITVAVFANE